MAPPPSCVVPVCILASFSLSYLAPMPSTIFQAHLFRCLLTTSSYSLPGELAICWCPSLSPISFRMILACVCNYLLNCLLLLQGSLSEGPASCLAWKPLRAFIEEQVRVWSSPALHFLYNIMIQYLVLGPAQALSLFFSLTGSTLTAL